MGDQSSSVAQRISKPLAVASQQIGTGVKRVTNLVHLEVIVTGVCLFIPVILILADGGAIREHISGYYDMRWAQYYYVPLTVAAMLFIVNGAVKDQHWYNLWLGLALIGVVLFDYEHARLAHNLAAAAFFVGNAAVFVIFTPKKELWFKLLLAGVMVAAFLGYRVLDLYSLFWAESFSLWVIAAHFALEARGLIK